MVEGRSPGRAVETTSTLATPSPLAGEDANEGGLLRLGEPAESRAPVAPHRDDATSLLRALLVNLSHPPLRERRFWYAQGLVLAVVILQVVADLARDANLLPVPSFVWYLLIFLPVIYAGTSFGLAGSLATAFEATAAALPSELIDPHNLLFRWAGLSTLVMVDLCALLLGDRYERSRREAELALSAERSRIAAYINGHPLSWRRLLGMLPDGIALVDPDGVVRFVNGQLEMLASSTRSELVGRSLAELFPGAVDAIADGSSTEGGRTPWRGMLTRGGGEEIPVDLLLRPIQLKGSPWLFVDVRDDRVRRAAEHARDEAERRERKQAAEAAKALAESEQRFRLIYESNMSGVVLVDTKDRVLEANAAFCELVGYSEEELVGNNSFRLTADEDRHKGDEIHARLLSGELAQAMFTKRYRHKDGHLLWVTIQKSIARDERGAIAYFVCSVHDVTSQHRLTTELNHQARHDPLTGLANRRLFEEQLATALRTPGEATYLGVLLLDLDDFKHVNDTLGHRAGDDLLIGVARRLQQVVRPGDTLSRFGGDEFLYLAPGLDSPEAAEVLAEQLLAALAAPFAIAGQALKQRASLGIAILDPLVLHDRSLSGRAETVLRNADIALYEAKSRGKNRPVLFTGTMREEVANHFELDQALGRALPRGEISMHYQPIIELQTGSAIGFEALMRWQRTWRGPVPPNTFIPLAEHSDRILELGSFALRAVAKEAASWSTRRPCGQPLRVAVNVSPRQLFAPRFTAEIGELLAETGLEPDRLVLEVTEGTLLGNTDAASRVLEDLRRRGISVAIDDFGTGYSSLSRLAHFRPSILKIDRSFVSPEQPRASTDTMLETILTLGRRLEIVVIAEGIETSAQRDRLVELGCELGQGFLFSPARPAGDLDPWLAPTTPEVPAPDAAPSLRSAYDRAPSSLSS